MGPPACCGPGHPLSQLLFERTNNKTYRAKIAFPLALTINGSWSFKERSFPVLPGYARCWSWNFLIYHRTIDAAGDYWCRNIASGLLDQAKDPPSSGSCFHRGLWADRREKMRAHLGSSRLLVWHGSAGISTNPQVMLKSNPLQDLPWFPLPWFNDITSFWL